MIEILTDPWFILAGLAGVGSSLLLGRVNVWRVRRLEKIWQAEERERIDKIQTLIDKQRGGRDG